MNKAKTLTIVLSGLVLLGGTTAYAQANQTPRDLNPHTYVLPRSVVGGVLKLKRSHHYSDGSTTFSYEVHDMDDPSSGWVYYMVNAHNPTHQAAVAMAQEYQNTDQTAQFGGDPYQDYLRSDWYYGLDNVQGTVELTDSGCRASVTVPYHRAAISVEVANFGSTEGCDTWVTTDVRNITKALIRRIP